MQGGGARKLTPQFTFSHISQALSANACVQILLNHGAHATARDSFGRPVLMIASMARSPCVWRDTRILCALLNHGAAEDPLVLPYMTQQVHTWQRSARFIVASLKF
jgi:hypothetical protein